MKKEEREYLLEALQSALDSHQWDVRRDGNTWQLTSKSDNRTMALPVDELTEQLAGIDEQEKKKVIIEEFVSRVIKALVATAQSIDLHEQRKRLYPVLRSASFQVGETPGKRLISKPHTAETMVLYVIDFGDSYVYVNEDMTAAASVTVDDVHQWALANLKKLPNEPKMDFVNGNRYYFFSQDEYAASRLLNDKLLSDMKKKMKGDMAVAVPHHDVLIMADLQNDSGYNVLGQMVMKFYGEGHTPITPLPFVVEDHYELTSIVVLPDAIKQKKTFK